MGFGGLGLPPASVAAAFASASGSGSPTTKASRFESGDHSYPCKRPLSAVNCIASPPLRSSSQTWLPFVGPGREEVNARYLPSGLQRGELSLSALEVIWRSLLPS